MNSTNTTNTQVRAGCYCRISSDPKDKRQGVERQREDTSAVCEVKGWTVAGFYIDNDRSASNGKTRPEWDRLLADINAGKIDAIVVWNQDRGWRQMSELEDLRKFFKKLGRKIHLTVTLIGDIDFDDPYSVAAAQQRTVNSELETAVMKIRQTRAHRQHAERGLPKWRKAFGYLPYIGDKKDDDGTRERDPITAPLVEKAYRVTLAGASLKDVARLFNDANAFGLNGKPWNESTVSQFLRKPRNAGLRSYHGEIVGKGTWEPLVDEKLWRSVQHKINAQSRKPGKKSVQQHLLTRMLQCGKPGCGGYLGGNWATQAHGGGPRAHSITYTCKKCHGVSVRAEHIEPWLYRLIGGRLAKPDAVHLLRAEIHDEAEAERIRAELATLHADVKQIGIDRGKRLLTSEQAKDATDVILADIAELEAQQEDEEMRQVLDGIPLGKPEAVQAVKELTPDRFRAVIRVLLTVTVAPVGKGSHVFNERRITVDWQRGLAAVK
jgi:DNA invertase Pin-like site-specific DNA recombinase